MLHRVTVVSLLAISLGHGQHVLYNQGKDKTAQDAAAAATEITSGATFDTMIHNLDIQAKREAETTVAFTREQMRSKIASARVWNADNEDPDPRNHKACSSVHCTLERLNSKLQESLPTEIADPAQVQARLNEIKKKADELKSRVKELQQTTAQAKSNPGIFRALDHLGDAKDVVGFGEQISKLAGSNQGTMNALGQISGGLDELIALYASVKSIWAATAQVNIKIGDLAPSPENIQLQLLALEEQHLKRLSEIHAQRELHAGDALVSIRLAENILKRQNLWDSNATIDETLDDAVRSASVRRALYTAVDIGTANAYVEALTPAMVVAPVSGIPFNLCPTHANTGAATFDAGFGALAITRARTNGRGTTLSSGDLVVNSCYVLVYNTAGPEFVLAVSPGMLRQVVGALYLFAAVAASEDTSSRLTAVRESDEERRYSIRKSAVNASTYDLTIQAAVQRLAVYHKSGLKPSDLAALVFYLTNSVAVPTIAAK